VLQSRQCFASSTVDRPYTMALGQKAAGHFQSQSPVCTRDQDSVFHPLSSFPRSFRGFAAWDSDHSPFTFQFKQIAPFYQAE
jgi:hypothetical protein